MTLRNYDLDKTLTVRQVLEIIEYLVPEFPPDDKVSGDVECEWCGKDTYARLNVWEDGYPDLPDFERAIAEALR